MEPQPVFKKMPQDVLMVRGGLFNNDVRTTGYLYWEKKKTNLFLYLTPYTKINARWSQGGTRKGWKGGRAGWRDGGVEGQREGEKMIKDWKKIR